MESQNFIIGKISYIPDKISLQRTYKFSPSLLQLSISSYLTDISTMSNVFPYEEITLIQTTMLFLPDFLT